MSADSLMLSTVQVYYEQTCKHMNNADLTDSKLLYALYVDTVFSFVNSLFYTLQIENCQYSTVKDLNKFRDKTRQIPNSLTYRLLSVDYLLVNSLYSLFVKTI